MSITKNTPNNEYKYNDPHEYENNAIHLRKKKLNDRKHLIITLAKGKKLE